MAGRVAGSRVPGRCPRTGRRLGIEIIRGNTEQQLPLASGKQVVLAQHALSLGRGEFALGKKPAKTRVGGAALRIYQALDAAFETQVAADKKLEPFGFGGEMGAHDSGQRVAVRDAYLRSGTAGRWSLPRDRHWPKARRPGHSGPGERAGTGSAAKLRTRERVAPANNACRLSADIPPTLLLPAEGLIGKKLLVSLRKIFGFFG